MIGLLRCYAMAVPILVWAVLLQFGVVDDDSSRVIFLVVQGVCIVVSIHSLHQRYRDLH